MFRTQTLVLALTGIVSMACGAKSPPASATPAEPKTEQPAEPAPQTAEVEFGDWSSWSKANSERKVSKGHGEAFVDVYVEETHAATYKAGEKGPVGMRVVKAQYKTADAAEPERLTVMAKRDEGYDPDNGDWYYGVFGVDGTSVKMQGKLGQCSGCHASASDRDFLFGTE